MEIEETKEDLVIKLMMANFASNMIVEWPMEISNEVKSQIRFADGRVGEITVCIMDGEDVEDLFDQEGVVPLDEFTGFDDDDDELFLED